MTKDTHTVIKELMAVGITEAQAETLVNNFRITNNPDRVDIVSALFLGIAGTLLFFFIIRLLFKNDSKSF